MDVGAQFIAPLVGIASPRGRNELRPYKIDRHISYLLNPNIFGYGCIEHPHDFALGGTDDLGWILVWLVWAFEYSMQGVRFICACN